MKTTAWTEIPAYEVTVLEVNREVGEVVGVKLSHPSLPRPRWFVKSARGNWYSRYTGREADACAQGFIVVGDLEEVVT